jgi:ribulose 1,5-bisphosphate carboxylase large subunit-like protein
MRLIDADALIEDLHHAIEGHIDLTKDYEYLGIDDYIRSMPTAYDVEKVILELEDNQMWKDYMIYELTHREYSILKKAIDIVKAGGKDDA